MSTQLYLARGVVEGRASSWRSIAPQGSGGIVKRITRPSKTVHSGR